MNIGIDISAKISSYKGKELKKIYDRYIKFEPLYFTNKYKTEKWNKLKYLKYLNKNDGKILITTTNYQTRETLSSGGAMLNSFQSITIIQNKNHLLFANNDILDIINPEFIISCYLYNEDYVSQQSAYNSSCYQVDGLDISLAKELSYTIDETGVKTYDISKNYGKADITRKTWLIAAWKMWLGKPFYELVSKERLLTFPHAVEIKELENEIIYIQLFEKVEESATPENREKQRLFREWCDFDGLVKKHS